MEKLIIQGNVYSGGRKTRYSCVRYGNVIGSRGSVIPLFLAQREAGEITLTDEKMTRFWITLEQGVRFVIDCIGRMRGGEVFVPKIPSMKVTDVADVIAPKAKQRIVGIRPGEKLNETLITGEEAVHTREFNDYFIIEPEFTFWDKANIAGSRPLPQGFSYTSDTNGWWLKPGEMKRMLEEL
jgi:FlaA1/EpsC-like NDP-sugar epimerase